MPLPSPTVESVRATHVLISRPQPEAAELAECVTSLGLQAVVIPAFEFRATGVTVQADAGWRTARRRLVVFTSPRAVRFGLPVIESGLLTEAEIAAVGPATAEALSAAGVPVHWTPSGQHDSEALLDLLDDSAGSGVALIVAAPGGRKVLRDGLKARGWRVREALVYQRDALAPEPTADAALSGAGSVISLWTSGGAMQHLLDSLSTAARQRVCEGDWVVASHRLGELAGRLGAAHVRVGDGADNAALVLALQRTLAEERA